MKLIIKSKDEKTKKVDEVQIFIARPLFFFCFRFYASRRINNTECKFLRAPP